MNGIVTETAGLNVGSNANIYFMLNWLDVKPYTSKFNIKLYCFFRCDVV